MRFTIPPHGAPDVDGIWIRAEGDDLPHAVLFRLGVGEDGQLVATGLLIVAERELTTRAVRLPLAAIVSKFAAEVEAKPSTYKRLQAELSGRDLEKDADWRAWAARGRSPADFVAYPRTGPVQVRARTAGSARLSRRPLPHRRQEVRASQAAASTSADSRTDGEEFHAAEPTVHRWIKTAREKGFIKDTKEDLT